MEALAQRSCRYCHYPRPWRGEKRREPRDTHQQAALQHSWALHCKEGGVVDHCNRGHAWQSSWRDQQLAVVADKRNSARTPPLLLAIGPEGGGVYKQLGKMRCAWVRPESTYWGEPDAKFYTQQFGGEAGTLYCTCSGSWGSRLAGSWVCRGLW